MDSEPTNGGRHDEAEAKPIRVYATHAEADLARANLQAHGIPCWINSDDAGGMLPNLTAPGGVRLLVRASDATAAIALLEGQVPAADIPDQTEPPEGIPSPDLSASKRKLALGQMIVGIVAGVLLCLLFQSLSQMGTRTFYRHTRDGKVEEEWIYRNGHLVELLKDRNIDGAWDEWVYYEHDRVARSEADNNFDGKPDETWTYSNGEVVRMEKDTDFNGTPDMFCTYKYGILQQMDIRPNGAKFATQRHLYQNGVLVESLRGGDDKGDFTESVRYDPFFNPISTNTPANQFLIMPQ